MALDLEGRFAEPGLMSIPKDIRSSRMSPAVSDRQEIGSLKLGRSQVTSYSVEWLKLLASDVMYEP